jgi:hypothetical protein
MKRQTWFFAPSRGLGQDGGRGDRSPIEGTAWPAPSGSPNSRPAKKRVPKDSGPAPPGEEMGRECHWGPASSICLVAEAWRLHPARFSRRPFVSGTVGAIPALTAATLSCRSVLWCLSLQIPHSFRPDGLGDLIILRVSSIVSHILNSYFKSL